MADQPSSRHSIFDDLFDDDPFAIILVPLVIILIVGASLPMWLDGATLWLIDHNILVAKTSHPTVAVPGADGAGLDIRRIVVVAAVVVAVCAAGLGTVRRRLRRET